MTDQELCTLLAATIAAGAFTGDEDDAHRQKIAETSVDLARRIDEHVAKLFEDDEEIVTQTAVAQMVDPHTGPEPTGGA